jgi:hypothetical protein
VAVGTGREAATVTAMMGAAYLTEKGAMDATFGVAGTSLCCGCGACTDHCKLHVPVAEILRGWRAPRVPAVEPEPLRAIDGAASTVCVVTGDRDWSGAWGRREGRAVARLRTGDALGYAAWRAGNAAVPANVARHLEGREAIADSGDVAEVLAAAGVPVRRLEAPSGERRFHTCFDVFASPGPRPAWGVDQLACCGRREGFPDREPEAAREVAEANARLLGPGRVACADEGCACWLRRHGVDVAGPSDTLGE